MAKRPKPSRDRVSSGGSRQRTTEKRAQGRRGRAKPAVSLKKADTPRLLSGGNPQIGKADGDAPVQAYVRAMPGWKREVGADLDALVMRLVPGAQKAVRWNTPFYGVKGQGWFMAFHCITKYVKVSFFNGAYLDPAPPIESKMKHVRYLHIFEHDRKEILSGPLLAAWIRQSSALTGADCF